MIKTGPTSDVSSLDPQAAGAKPPDVMSAIIAATQAITLAPDEPSLFAAVIESLSFLGYDLFTLSRFCDDAKTTLELVGVWQRSGPPPLPAGTRLSRAAYPAMDKISAGAPIFYDDCNTDPRIHPTSRVLMVEKMGIQAMSLIPLMHCGEFLGALSANRYAPHVHTPEEIQTLILVAQLTAVALLGIRSRDMLARKIQLVQALYRAGDALAGIPGEAALLEAAPALLVNDVGYVLSWVGLVDHDRGVLVSRGGLGKGYRNDPDLVYPLNNPQLAAVAAFHEGRPVVHRDLLTRSEADGWGEVAASAGLRTGVYVPLRAGGKVLGVIGVGSSDERMSDDEVALIAAFANHLAAAIVRARMDRERAEQLVKIEDAYEGQARLLDLVRELSTPVIPIHDGILVLPLVGTIDSKRAAQIMDSLLGAIQRDHASVVLLDVTGVPMVDTSVIDHLLRAIRAASLLGARAVLVGITPSVAQTMVQLGVDLGGVVTRSNLQAGIAHALTLLGLEIRAEGRAAARR